MDSGVFAASRRALLPLLSGPDRQVMSLTPDDPEAFPMLLAWCQATLARLAGHTRIRSYKKRLRHRRHACRRRLLRHAMNRHDLRANNVCRSLRQRRAQSRKPR